MNKGDAIKRAKQGSYFTRKEGPEIICPACKSRVQCYRQSSPQSIVKQIDAGIRFHIDGGYCDSFPYSS